MVDYVIRLLLCVDDFVLFAKIAQRLREHLSNLETFCTEVGMEVNTSNTKIMVFSLRKREQ